MLFRTYRTVQLNELLNEHMFNYCHSCANFERSTRGVKHGLSDASMYNVKAVTEQCHVRTDCQPDRYICWDAHVLKIKAVALHRV